MSFCIKGEYRNPTSSLCEVCGKDTYTVLQDSAVCLPCPEHATCPGGFVIDVSPGYWRKSTDSDIVVDCYHLEENCIGGTGDNLCFNGHIGALCEACDIDGSLWS